MRVAVTGGAGFIGHHLVRRLLERGDDVRVLDDLSTGRRERLPMGPERAELIVGDIRDAAVLADAFRDVDVVFHEAAIPSVARSIADAGLTDRVNVGGTVSVMLAAAAAGVRRVVFAGSCSVYGANPDLPHHEGLVPQPLSPYAAVKLAGEGYVHTLGAIHGIETVVLRYFNVYGPGQDPGSEYAAVVPRFITAAVSGQRPIVFGDGRQRRDFVHVDDVASANLLAATVPGVSGLTANIASGETLDLLDLLDQIGTALGRRLDPEFRPARAGDVARSSASIELARTALGYHPSLSPAAGIAATVDWYRAQADHAA
jgi:UDP-glucose 4-epimerase